MNIGIIQRQGDVHQKLLHCHCAYHNSPRKEVAYNYTTETLIMSLYVKF